MRKTVRTWAQMAVDNLPRCDNIAPSPIIVVKLVAKPDEFRRRKTGTCVVEIDVLITGGELERNRSNWLGLLLPIPNQFEPSTGAESPEDELRISHGQSAVQ